MVLLDVHVCLVECILVLTNLLLISLVKTVTVAASLSGIKARDIWETPNYNICGKIGFRI